MATQPWSLASVLLGAAVVLTLLAFLIPPPDHTISIAFVGNSMMFVNDLPRFMQEIAGKSPQGDYLLTQNSCLHGALHFKSLLKKGNGMLHKWNTKSAYIEGAGVHDYGACTVRQLLLGYDESLSYKNSNGNYTNDGKNPCFKSSLYYEYITGMEMPEWDFVLLNDQTTYPAIAAKRNQSLRVLQERYVPLLGNNSIPVLYATHGYESSFVNVTKLGNVSQFTSLVFEGYRQYAQILEQYLLPQQTPRIAPVGLAFLVVYEENREMWDKLFYIDGFHPSPHGSYLMGCVLHATLTGRMPPGASALPDDPSSLWNRARRMEIGSKYVMPFPTKDEVTYLYHVARKVMILNHRPNTWIRHFNESESDYIVQAS
jgi:hypothetical protein